MRHLAAYMLLVAGGNASPSAADVKTLLESASIDTNEERLTQLIAELNGKDLNELIALGKDKLHVGGGVAAAAAPAAGAAAPAAAAPAAKEEKKKEEEVDALSGGLDMFGGGGGGKGDY